MKVGDLIEYDPKFTRKSEKLNSADIGTVIDFPPAKHAKEFQKVKVLSGGEFKLWIKQFCKVVSQNDEPCSSCCCTPCDCDWGID